MSPLELLAYQIEWAAKDIAYNLDFVPTDKLNWKPAATAKSVLEIVNELGIGAPRVAAILEGKGSDPTSPETKRVSTVTEAKELVLTTARAYAQTLRALAPQDVARSVDLGFGPLPLATAAGIPVIEFIHHRGQIVYIQTLLGDTQDHFDMAAL